MLSVPVLAVGVVGCCLGATVVRLWRPRAPVVPAALVREIVDAAAADRAEADRRFADVRAAMDVVAQELGTDRRALAQARTDLELAEEDLAMAHVEAAQARLGMVLLAAENERLRADPPWMQQPIAAFAPLEHGGNVVLLDPWTGFR